MNQTTVSDGLEQKRDTFGKAMGFRLAAAREEKGLSTRDVAVRLSLFQEDIEGFESGIYEMPINLLPEFCQLFRKPVSFWIDDDGNPAGPILVVKTDKA